jgi:hypothetical protein
MQAVVTFWWFRDEEESFLAFLEEAGQVMALPFRGTPKKDELKPRPLKEYIINDDPQQLFFFLTGNNQDIVIEPIESFEDGKTLECFRVVDMKSCVIGYDRGRVISSSKLTASNLYAYWAYPNASGVSMVAKSDGFVTWAKKVFSRVYKMTPDWHQYKNYRVSKRVKDAILNEGLQIAPY